MGVQLISVSRELPKEMAAKKQQRNRPADKQLFEEQNLLAGFLTDKQYFTLLKAGFFNPTALRNRYIYLRYHNLKQTLTASDAIDILMEEFPELSFDSLKKIIYSSQKLLEE